MITLSPLGFVVAHIVLGLGIFVFWRVLLLTRARRDALPFALIALGVGLTGLYLAPWWLPLVAALR